MLATGVDLVEVARVARVLERYGARFLERIYTPAEIRFARGRPAELAARFAAKEAVAKALGVGMRMLSPIGVGWHDVEVLNERSGRPYVRLHGRAQALAADQGLIEWSLSLTHDGGLAMAFVVAMGKEMTNGQMDKMTDGSMSK
jgi:holo-[acyl-carrier protein] synthase